MLTRTVILHECRCACCGRSTCYYLAPEDALDMAKARGWCFDYAALDLLICGECNEQGRIPNVDEDLALTAAPDVVR